MKKLMIVAVMMLTAFTASAQPAESQIKVKPFAGLNSATFASDDDAKAKFGFVGGVEGEFGMTGNTSVSIGLAYSQMGAKLKLSNWTDDPKMKCDYLTLSLVDNYYLAPGFAVKAGLQGGLNIKKKISDSSATMDIDDFFKALGKDTKYETFDYGVVVGASYEYKNIVLDARYYIGVAKVMKDFDDKNRVLSITLGYNFGL